jgi:hypothetical protein
MIAVAMNAIRRLYSTAVAPTSLRFLLLHLAADLQSSSA